MMLVNDSAARPVEVVAAVVFTGWSGLGFQPEKWLRLPA